MRKKIGVALYILVILLGAVMFVYGGFDDSPGGQLLGVVMIVSGIIGIVKNRQRSDKQRFPPENEP